MANNGQAKKANMIPLLIAVGCSVGGTICLDQGMDGLGIILCAIGIPVAIVSIVLTLKKKK